MEQVWIFRANSPQAAAIVSLLVQTLVVAAVILAIVTGFVLYIIVRYRHRAGAGEPRQIFGHKRLEFVWTALPCLVLVWLFYLTAHAMNLSDPPADREPDLVVIGHQWWWEAHYRNSGVTVANEIHLPVGARWLVRLESADVIHDFWVPQLARKMDMVPGHPNHLWLQADTPGTYLGSCGEYCGAEHAWMRFIVVAQAPAEFAAWERQQQQPAPAAVTEAAARGARLFREMTCVNCHAVGGTAFSARAGPDLTHGASRQWLGAGVIENTPRNLALWLKDPQAIKPGCFMPNLHLNDGQIASLTDYLEGLK